MTSEAIKALMVLAMFGVLELALYFSSITRPARQPVRSNTCRGAARHFTRRSSAD